MSDTIQKYERLVEKTKRKQQELDKVTGAIEQLEKQLVANGFADVAAFEKWEKKVVLQIEKLQKDVKELLAEAEEILQ